MATRCSAATPARRRPGEPRLLCLNDEALANYAHDALKKTRDTAIYLIEQRYGAAPERSYFAGGSTGGREALTVVQQWPTDFNGAIVLYPAYNALALDLQFGRITAPSPSPAPFPAGETCRTAGSRDAGL